MTSRKARRVASEDIQFKDIHFEDFPGGDDLWWLRWFDYDGFGGAVTGTAMLRTVFSRLDGSHKLDNLPTLSIHLGIQRSEQKVVRLQAGWLPMLSIGLVVQSSKVVGQLGATLKRFAFNSKAHLSQVEFLHRPKHDLATPFDVATSRGGGQPASVGPGRGVLGSGFYRLNGVEDGRVLSICGRRASAPEHLIVPCPEVFRVAYAPHRLLALALLAGPWGTTVRGVLDPDATRCVPAQGNSDDRWEVAAREGLGRAHAAVAANLWLNPAGRKAADGVWRAISTISPYGGVIEAPLPFDWDLLEIETAGYVIRTKEGGAPRDIWFGYAVTGIRWPDRPFGPPDAIELLPTRTRGPPQAPGSETGTGVTQVKVVELAPGQVEAVQNTDPSEGSVAVAVSGVGPAWWNSPLVTRGTPLDALDGRKVVATTKSTSLISAGAGNRREKDVVTAQVQATDPFGGSDLTADRFTRVVDMLDRLEARRSIASHAELQPPHAQAARRGTLTVWAFPKVAFAGGHGTERWYMRTFRSNPPRFADVRRAAMVRSVVVDGSVVYWVETEQRTPSDAYMSLIFAESGAGRLNHVVGRLLEIAAARRGVWPDSAELCSRMVVDGVPGIAAAVTWKHPPVTTPHASGDATALTTLKAVAAAGRP